MYESLADMWSTWYGAYLDADFPRLMIRFEDTLFHAERVMEIITDCVGGRPGEQPSPPFRYHLGKSKRGPSSDFPTALGKYGREAGRYDGMTADDRKYALSALDEKLMRTFRYPQITTPSSSAAAGDDTATSIEKPLTDEP